MPSQKTVTSTGGFVQMMALIALGTISAVVMGTMLVATRSGSSTAALQRLVVTDALTTSAFARLEAAMIDPADDLETAALRSDAPTQIQVGDVRVAVRIEGIGGKIDPTRTAPEVMSRYLANSHLSTDEIAAIMTAIGKARDAGNIQAAYEAVLAGLLDRSPEQDIWRDFTQFSDHSGLDPFYASPRVIAAIPDLPASPTAGISGSTIQDLAQRNLQSQYFEPNGGRFSLVAYIAWGPNQSSERQLPVEISSAGRMVALAGPN